MLPKLSATRWIVAFCFLLISTAVLAQQRRVTGTIRNTDDNSPIVGATVTVRGTNISTQTDANGVFSLNVPNGRNVLTITNVGFASQDVNIANQANINIGLRTTTANLNEVVVTGYTTQRKKDITGSVATVDVTDAKKIPTTSSEQLLQGQASGVTVLTSGAPGAPSTVFVRGISNFGNTTPLYVVDGVQVGDMSLINPNDIASISVLKDAGAAAIYGISGGNGVIVITTKKGRIGKTTISYDGYYGTQQPLSGNVWHLMNPSQQSVVAYRANDPLAGALYPGGSGTVPVYGYHGTSAAGSFGKSGVTNDPGIEAYYHFDASNANNDFLVQKFATGQGTDWFHSIFKPAPMQSHTITASGGSDRSTYLFSINYLDQQGTLLNTYEKRYQARLNTTFSVKDHIRFGENGYVTYRQNRGGYNGSQQQEGGSISYTYREMPMIPIYDIGGNFGGGYAVNNEALGNGSSPYAIQARIANDKAQFVTVQGNVFAEADILRNFTLRTSYGVNLYNQYWYGFGYNTYENYESHNTTNGSNENEQIGINWNWTNTLQYKKISGKHNLSVLAGYEMKANTGREFHGYGSSYFSMDPNYVQLQFGTPVTAPTSYIWQPTSTVSVFGRADYIFNDRYILGATVRRDGYSIFYTGHQWGTFPSVSAGWRISQEEFMKSVSWLNNLLIRGSYGVAGNNGNIGGNNAYSSYASGTGNSYYGITGSLSAISQGFYQNQIGNPNTTWETDKITNVGVDVSLFNHLDVTAEWYKKSIGGLLFTQPLVATVGGAARPQINIGDVQNTGVDISANYRGKIGRDFNFGVGVNVTTYKSLITNIPGSGYFDFGSSRDLPIVRNQVGHAIGSFYGYKVLGIYQNTSDTAKSAYYKGASAGAFIYEDVNHDGKIDANDRTWIGNPNPKFTYGINLNASYKAFDFSMILYGSQGNQDFNYVKYWTDFWGTFAGGKNLDLYNKAAIVQNGKVTNPDATLPAASFTQAMGSSTVSSFYVENGSFLKCRAMQLGYTLNPNVLRRAGIDKVHIYVQATNLFTITKYSGLDPELIPSLSNNGSGVNRSAAFGIDYGAYPNNQKVYMLGLNLSF